MGRKSPRTFDRVLAKSLELVHDFVMNEFFEDFWPLFVAVAHTLIIAVASSHVVLTKRDNRSAIGWVGIIWLTPFLGAMLYYLFGINRIHRVAKRLREGQEPTRTGWQASAASQSEVLAILAEENESLRALVSFIGKVTDLPLLPGNRITPLKDGDIAYAAMLSAIAKAQRSISLATYIFDNDEVGREFADALAAAQQRGVQVRVLIDSVGTRYTWPSILSHLRKLEVRHAVFLPTLIPWQLHYTNLRNHRKILVIDGKLGFTGGMNIRQGHRKTNPGHHPVQDLHFQVEGPVVAHLQETFAHDWEFTTNEVIGGDLWFPQIPKAGPALCRGISDGPELSFDKLQLTLQGAIDCARHRIVIMTPYFLPELPLITALVVAALRGVQVQILLPEKNNLRLVQWASTALLWQVLQHGCRVYLTPQPFDHTKLVLVDNCWSMFGSANWDPRSLRLNFEMNIECYDDTLADDLAQLVADKLARSREITLKDVDSRPIWMRLRDGIARLAQPYL